MKSSSSTRDAFDGSLDDRHSKIHTPHIVLPSSSFRLHAWQAVSNRKRFDFGVALKSFQAEDASTLESLPSGFKPKTFRLWNRSQAVSNRKRFEFGIAPKRFQTENIPTLEPFSNDFKAKTFRLRNRSQAVSRPQSFLPSFCGATGSIQTYFQLPQ